jgi:hypothetical protein
MKIYHYHPVTKELTGEDFARLSPLDKKHGREVYLIPAGATTIEPPEFVEGKARVFDGEKWEYVDIEVPARQDIENNSPATETAFKKVEKLLNQIIGEVAVIIGEIHEMKLKINENEHYFLNQVESFEDYKRQQANQIQKDKI